MESIDNVEKSLIHISHLHPLKLIESPEPRPICHACNMSCADESYGCIDCPYFLHVTCATTRRSMDHPSHPDHTLNFELTPSYPNGTFVCDACGVDGTSFGLQCRECSFDLHLPCAAIPPKVNHPSHDHALGLAYENPYQPNTGISFTCDLCEKDLDVNKWFYLCTSCDYGGHVGCFARETLEVVSSSLERPAAPQMSRAAQAAEDMNSILQMQKEMMQVQLQLNANRVLASCINSAIRGSRI